MATIEPSGGVKSRWYEDDQRNTSALRVIVIPASIIGLMVVCSGVVAMFLSLNAAGVALTAGAGMVATAQAAKAWQKSNEKGN